MFSRDEMQRAIEDALKSMEGVALELYRRGREESREELETVKRERDEARAEVERLREMAHDFEAMREDRDAAIARITEVGVMVATNGNALAKEAYRRGAEAMREACARECHEQAHTESMLECVEYIRALPTPEEP